MRLLVIWMPWRHSTQLILLLIYVSYDFYVSIIYLVGISSWFSHTEYARKNAFNRCVGASRLSKVNFQVEYSYYCMQYFFYVQKPWIEIYVNLCSFWCLRIICMTWNSKLNTVLVHRMDFIFKMQISW